MERQLKDLLERRADDMDLAPAIPERTLRRARRRRALTALAAAAVSAAFVVGTVAGVGRFLDRPTGTTPAGEADGAGDWRGMWPHETRTAAEEAQARADEGDTNYAWQTNAGEVAERYGFNVLGWDRVFAVTDTDGRPATARLGDCSALDAEGCPREVRLTLEQLIRPGEGGVWTITSQQGAQTGCEGGTTVSVLDGVERVAAQRHLAAELADTLRRTGCRVPQIGRAERLYERTLLFHRPEAESAATWLAAAYLHGAELRPADWGQSVALVAVLGSNYRPPSFVPEDFVLDFLQHRVDGAGAEAFLSPQAEDQYARAGSGLSLYGPASGSRYIRFEIVDIESADASSYVVTIRMVEGTSGEDATGSFLETLFVGPGANVAGEQLGLVVRGAERQDLASPPPPPEPTDDPGTSLPDEVEEFVLRFLAAREARSGAEAFLSKEARRDYDERLDGLALYDPQVDRYALVNAEGDPEGPYRIRIERRDERGPDCYEAGFEFIEVGAGTRADGTHAELIVRTARQEDVVVTDCP